MFAPTLALPAHYPPGLTDVGTALSQVSHHFKQVKVVFFLSFFLHLFILLLILIFFCLCHTRRVNWMQRLCQQWICQLVWSEWFFVGSRNFLSGVRNLLRKKKRHVGSFLKVHQNKWSEKSPIYSHHLRLETWARDVVRVFVSQSCSMNRERETRVAGHSIHTFYHQAISQPFIAVLVTRYAYLRSEIPNPGVHFYPVCSSFRGNHRSTVFGHKRKLSPSGGNARQVEIDSLLTMNATCICFSGT